MRRAKKNRYGAVRVPLTLISEDGTERTALYRSGLEARVARQLNESRANWDYESTKFPYVVERTYTPDFRILKSNGDYMFIETKGHFTPADRSKSLKVRAQHPEIDLRFIFANAYQKISKNSKTLNYQWADQHGFLWSTNGEIPRPWLYE